MRTGEASHRQRGPSEQTTGEAPTIGALVDGFERLKRDVFARAELDEVLDPVNEGERAVGVPLANVARFEPAVLSEGLGIKIGPLEVVLEDGASAEEDLTLRMRLVRVEVASVGVVCSERMSQQPRGVGKGAEEETHPEA